jgi:hypothetical protein
MEDRQAALGSADLSAKLANVNPRAVGVQHQKVDTRQQTT